MRYVKFITRAMLRAEPDTLFVFGDNMKRRGLGGQAKDMRGEPNAVGIPTKIAPGMKPADFFTDDDFERARVEIETAAKRLSDHIETRGKVVWPEDGIGTGLAQLPERAPWIWKLLEQVRLTLEQRSSAEAC